MLDIGNGNSQQNIDKIILKAVKGQKERGFEDMSF